MGWIRTEYHGIKMKVFTISRRQALNANLLSILEDRADDPGYLASFVEALVVVERPELVGCVVEAIIFDAPTQRWHFTVTHGSFSCVAHMAMPPEEPLMLADRLGIPSEVVGKLSDCSFSSAK